MGARVSFHLENLIPGVATAAALVALYFDEISLWAQSDAISRIEPFYSMMSIFLSITFICNSYLLGIFIWVISRPLFDIMSSISARQFWFRVLESDLICSGFFELNKKYRNSISAVFKSNDEAAIVELSKRRERGRMIRDSGIPIWLFSLSAFDVVGWNERAVYASIVYFIVLNVYAYAEFTVYQEAKLHSDQ